MLNAEQLLLGFHHLKRKCNSKKRMVAVVESIVEWFDLILENTVLTAPLRTKAKHGSDPYRLKSRKRSAFNSDSKEEAKLERSLARNWDVAKSERGWFWPDHCQGFVNYQVPLYNKQKSAGWRSIGLVGLSPSSMPQVWELKRRHPAESPFLMVVEAIAYGVALRHAWNRGEFATEWKTAGLVKSSDSPIRGIELFGVAPTDYWKKAREKWLNTPELRTALIELMARSKSAGLPVKLVEFTAKYVKNDHYFDVGRAGEVEL